MIKLFHRYFHEGRGGRTKLAISTGVVAKIFTTFVSFVTLPITVRYLGNEGYGLMIAISSVVGWLQFTNMGLGLGLQNALTEETAKGDLGQQRQLVSTAVFALTAVGGVLLIFGAASFPFINWLRIFPPSSAEFAGEIPWTVFIVFFGFVSTVILGFVGPIYAARQELHLGTIQSIVCALITLLGTLFVVYFRLGIIGIVSVTVGGTAAVQWTFALWTLYGRNIQELRPSMTSVTSMAWGRIFGAGSQFFILQLCNIVFYQLDAMLIMHHVSSNDITPYAVAQKVFLQLSAFFGIFTGSLWGAYGNARAQGDVEWIKLTHRKMVILFFLFFGGVSIGMICGGRQLLIWWVGSNSAPSVSLLAGVAFYFCIREWTALHAMLLNGLNLIREQIPPLMITCLMVLLLEIGMLRQFGTIGLAVGGGMGFLLGSGWYLSYLTRRTLFQMSEEMLSKH
jgi:O-antigen/teichoic acid export membrane protein